MKLSKKIEQEAQDLMKADDYPELIINKKGEFFTSMSLALMSVENKKVNLTVLKRTVLSVDPGQGGNKALEVKLAEAETALTECTGKLEEFKGLSAEGQIENNEAVKLKLEKRIDVLKAEVEELSNQLKTE
ncbi:MAG: hypothetical protein COC06_07570 [Bacteroidales bacterium]|nr:MAG: hypothetical protein COC06_07570 [Bacteroidales bacterium]